MLYYNFEAGNNAYKLKIDIQNMVNLEKTLGCNPLMVFGQGDRVPTVTEMIAILHYSLQHFNHGITLEKSRGIFEEYLDDGNQVTDFIQHIIGIYRVSGLMKPEGAPEEEDEKN